MLGKRQALQRCLAPLLPLHFRGPLCLTLVPLGFHHAPLHLFGPPLGLLHGFPLGLCRCCLPHLLFLLLPHYLSIFLLIASNSSSICSTNCVINMFEGVVARLMVMGVVVGWKQK
jgi:hypothetical protein